MNTKTITSQCCNSYLISSTNDYETIYLCSYCGEECNSKGQITDNKLNKLLNKYYNEKHAVKTQYSLKYISNQEYDRTINKLNVKFKKEILNHGIF